eukprot:269514-Prorocentrum_minimum.AAC.2
MTELVTELLFPDDRPGGPFCVPRPVAADGRAERRAARPACGPLPPHEGGGHPGGHAALHVRQPLQQPGDSALLPHTPAALLLRRARPAAVVPWCSLEFQNADTPLWPVNDQPMSRRPK